MRRCQLRTMCYTFMTGHAPKVDCMCMSEKTCNVRLNLSNDKLEYLWLEILLPESKLFIRPIGVCYRSSKQLDFCSVLEDCFKSDSKLYNTGIILLGYFNTDISCMHKNNCLMK